MKIIILFLSLGFITFSILPEFIIRYEYIFLIEGMICLCAIKDSFKKKKE